MSTVLVVYVSWAGSTAAIAHRVGTALTHQGATVRVSPAASAPDPAGYDGVVIGSAVRGGSWHPMAMDWAASHAAKLSVRPTAFFSVCLTPAAHPKRISYARGYTLPVTIATGVHPVSTGLFAGAYEPDRHAFRDRAIARLWGARQGDYRDWHAIDAWAVETAPRLDRVAAPNALNWKSTPLR